MQELIYKHGQAGITKATVSITFDNRDKRQCPIGYENHDEITVTRQVVMGGKNKYLINGINVQNKRVSDLFCSVQLNVNNPHFLIMQGRITKVLNMKPPEILSMVEEAAGTRMYEAKKQAAQKTIEKKDAKLRELNDIIREDIAPKLQKLQDERSQFQEYQKVVRELENITRLCVAWKYVSAEEQTKAAEGKVTQVQDDIKLKKETIKNNEKEMKELDKQVVDLNKKLDEESGNVLKDLEVELQNLEKVEAAASSQYKGSKEALSGHEKRVKLLEKALAEDEQALTSKQQILNEVSSTFENLRTSSETSEKALAEAQQKFLAVSTGKEDASESLQDQLMAAKQQASEASTRITSAMMDKKHAEERLKTLEKEFTTSSKQYDADQESIRRQQAQVEQLERELAGLAHDESRVTSLGAAVRGAQGAARGARDRRDALAAALQRCHFRYSPPDPHFDRARVAGTVCKLIDVCDPVYCTALETAAGGRLYNVVVDTEVTSKLLLQRGNLQTRTTIIPLNKISGQVIDKRIVQIAQEIGGGPENVQLALDLISFDSRLRPAMAWVFGSTLVCRDLDTAKRVTFHRAVRRRCVTLDGDVFDPSGTLSGGAALKGGSVLLQLQELKQLEQQVQAAEARLAQLTEELGCAQQAAESYAAIQQKCEAARLGARAAAARLGGTARAQLHAEIQALRAQAAQLAAALEQDELVQDEAAGRARDLEAKLKDIKGHREREYKKAEEALKKAKRDVEVHGGAWKLREQELETLRLEAAELQRGAAAARHQLHEHARAAADLARALHDAARSRDHAQEAVKEMQARIKHQKTEIAGRSTDISRLVQQKERLAKSSSELELGVKELDYRIKELQTEALDCQKKMRQLESENPWIPSERQYFGAPGGLYDFEGRQAHVAASRLHQLAERRDRLARGLNARAHTLLGKEEDQYQDVMRKKQIVEADRAKLVQVMAELDEKKKKTLVTACEQVNRDFGSIFSTLLPGAQAKLQPPDGLSVLDGLEVKVGFNMTWKESLGELSGGQRSLVALALVLAMLLFKPAPLYILDEVDAALDLSHTQNIGIMLKEHFRHSQFIIVSLKDGMFNNANVLFRTRFVDGMSSVQRTAARR